MAARPLAHGSMARCSLSVALLLCCVALPTWASLAHAAPSVQPRSGAASLHHGDTAIYKLEALQLGSLREARSTTHPHHKQQKAQDQQQQGASVTLQADGQLTVGPLGAPGALAEAVFVDGASTPSNMGHLEVFTWPVAEDEQQMRAAGFVEAWLTAERIAQHFANMWAHYNLTHQPDALEWLGQQQAWIRQQAQQAAGHAGGSGSRPQGGSQQGGGQGVADAGEGSYWAAVRLLLAQFDGMVEGYAARRTHLQAQQQQLGHQQQAQTGALPELTHAQMYALCSLGDMADIAAALQRQKRQQGGQQEEQRQQQQAKEQQQRQRHLGRSPMEPRVWDDMAPDELQVELATTDRCSALVKVSPDFQDLWVGQVAWFTYAAMLRVFKHYDFALSHPGVLSRSLAFSSYYGQLSSDDDFYLVGDTNLAVLQTTNRIFDETLLDRIQPQSALSWQRVRAACAVAEDGPSWAQAVRTRNSGTYTNSWLVLAADLFERGKPLPPWLLTVVEQVPGNVWHQDVTRSLESGYVALYNIPVLAETYNALGYPSFVQRMSNKGPAFREAVSGALWQVAPRAQIFRRDHGSVQTLEGMQRLMRSNNWQTDPFSLNSSTNAICGRGDVHPTSPRLAGCYDGKVSSLSMVLSLEAEVVNGPPYHPDTMPPFAWEGAWADAPVSHVGQPQTFAFDWERKRPGSTRLARASRAAAAGGGRAAGEAAA